MDLTETVKTLLHLAQEHGYITCDDINDVLPDNLSAFVFDLPKLRIAIHNGLAPNLLFYLSFP